MTPEQIDALAAALAGFAERAAARVVGLSDAKECRRVLRTEMVRALVEAGLDVANDPEAQARLDRAVADALADMRRLSARWRS